MKTSHILVFIGIFGKISSWNNFILSSFFVVYWNFFIILFVILSIAKNFFICLRRPNFSPEQEKLAKKCSLKNFSVMLSVCWFTWENGESLHPILLDSFSIFISVISMQSDKWKIFGWRLFFPPSFEGGGPHRLSV